MYVYKAIQLTIRGGSSILLGVVLHKKGNILGCVSHRYSKDIQGRYLWLYNYMAVYNGM